MTEGKIKTRRLKRMDSVNLVSFSHIGPEGSPDLEIVGRTIDLSEGGILLEIPSKLPSSSHEVEITLGIRDNIIHARGNIIHLREIDDGHFALGISFIDLSETVRQVIADFLSEE